MIHLDYFTISITQIIFFILDITAVLYKVPDTNDVLGLLVNIEHKWKSIGKALGVSESDLIAAFQDSNDNRARLSLVLTSWKESKSTPTTWETIIRVLESLEHNSTAYEIRQVLAKHCLKYAHMNDIEGIPVLPSELFN